MGEAGEGADEHAVVSFTDSKGFVVSLPAHARHSLYDLISGEPGEAPLIKCADLPPEAILCPDSSGTVCLSFPEKLSSLYSRGDGSAQTASTVPKRQPVDTESSHWVNAPSLQCGLNFKHRMYVSASSRGLCHQSVVVTLLAHAQVLDMWWLQ